ncbi:UNVERIFIED_CONTAM: endonuclease [Campylobacter lari]
MSLNGTKIKTGVATEPINFFKGNVARAYLYFQITYKGKATSKKSPYVFDNSSFPYFKEHYLNVYKQ